MSSFIEGSWGKLVHFICSLGEPLVQSLCFEESLTAADPVTGTDGRTVLWSGSHLLKETLCILGPSDQNAVWNAGQEFLSL